MTWQVLANEIRLLIRTVGPTLLFTTILLVMFFIGRAVGHLEEQRRIRTHLDQITKDELKEAERKVQQVVDEKAFLCDKLRAEQDQARLLSKAIERLGYVKAG